MKPDISIAEVRSFLKEIEGQEISLDKLRSELGIEKYNEQGIISKSFVAIRPIISELVDHKLLRYVGRGLYMVVKQVQPVQVFGIDRERRPFFDLIFPRDYNTMREMDFAEDVVVREGDLILISGMSNYGKTTVCMNFCGENIDKNPILMGNEYTIVVEQTETHPNPYDIAPRFLSRLDTMDVANGGWIDWKNKDGSDGFKLLPVWADYAEHIVKNKINIIDWVNLPGEFYMISSVMESIKKSLGRGVGILALQKNEDKTSGRGGAMTRDFADLELLIDKFGNSEVLLTLGKVKEARNALVGRTYAYSISEGVKIHNFREVKKCPACKGSGYTKNEKCSMCWGMKFIDKES